MCAQLCVSKAQVGCGEGLELVIAGLVFPPQSFSAMRSFAFALGP
jgi:hypothetical protein